MKSRVLEDILSFKDFLMSKSHFCHDFTDGVGEESTH